MTRFMLQGLSWSGHERNCVYVNRGDGSLANASFASGLDFLDDGRSVAAVDWDEDGDLDLWLGNRTGPRLRLMRNDRSGGHFVQLRLRGNASNRDAIGARVEVRTGESSFTRELVAGQGYLSQSSKWLHFGLGEAPGVERIVVHWPGGEPEVFHGVEVDGRYRLTQGSGEVVPLASRSSSLKAVPFEVPAPASTAVLLKVPLEMPPTVTAMLFDRARPPRAKLVNLWAHWCAPCVKELEELAGHYQELHAAGLDVVPINVDEEHGRPAAEKLFGERIAGRMEGPAFASVPADAGLEETIDALLDHVLGLHGELTLPTSLLIDPQGRLQVVYLGPVLAGRLLTDSARYLSDDVPHRRSLWPGRWYFRTPRALVTLGRDLRERGQKDDARFYFALEEYRKSVNSSGRR